MTDNLAHIVDNSIPLHSAIVTGLVAYILGLLFANLITCDELRKLISPLVEAVSYNNSGCDWCGS